LNGGKNYEYIDQKYNMKRNIADLYNFHLD